MPGYNSLRILEFFCTESFMVVNDKSGYFYQINITIALLFQSKVHFQMPNSIGFRMVKIQNCLQNCIFLG